jgi:glycosyltransferase involved in cell wall biosynthesis
VRDLLQKSSIVAFPSWYREGVPKSLIEACASGRPIVTCNSIGCKDVVDDGVNGFLVPVRDSDALAEKLRILIEDKDLRIKMGKAAREKAEREFSLDKVVQKHLEIYQSLIKNKAD